MKPNGMVAEALKRANDTKALRLGAGAVSQTGMLFRELFPESKAVVVADRNTWKAAGERVCESLGQAGVEQNAPYIIEDEDLYAEWSFLERVEAFLASDDAIAVAVGSGVINDLTKLASHHLGRRYVIVGTAASMDGYTAFGASITKDGNKQTFSCRAPYGMVFDPEIAAKAPKELAASGYADLIAKVPAAADWMIADALGEEPIDDFAYSLLHNDLMDALSCPSQVLSGDVEATGKLANGLIMSGFAMQAIQSSRPASGTEHQFSHCWDMEGLSYPSGKHVSHGFKVGIGTLVSTLELEFLLSKDLACVDADAVAAAWKTWPEIESEIRTVCAGRPGHLARCLEETREKFIDRDRLREQVLRLKSCWGTLSEKIRRTIIPTTMVYDNLKAVGAPYEPEMICVSRKHLKETFSFIPFMRSRFTNIDLLYRLGLLGEFTDSIFGKGGRWEVDNC
ncbi:MAG: sn-glycerol-1-phosphate dehydrogenase [Candidatus Cryptobacteroides sp.]